VCDALSNTHTHTHIYIYIYIHRAYQKIGAVLKLIIFTSMVNRIINTSRSERVTQQVYDTYLQIFDVCTLRHMAYIEAIVQFLPYSALLCSGVRSGDRAGHVRGLHGPPI